MTTSPSPRLQAALGALPLCRIAFMHRLLEDAELPALKGDLWRSVFGAALHRVAPAAAEVLMGNDVNEADRPWALTGPEFHDEWAPSGAELPGSLLLVGDVAIAQRAACLHALAVMARRAADAPECGLGRGRAQAELDSLGAWDVAAVAAPLAPVAMALPSESRTVSAWSVWQHGQQAERADIGDALRVAFATPLRLKQDGGLFRAPPPMSLLIRRLLGRLVRLLPQCPGGVLDRGEKKALLALAARCELVEHHMGGMCWKRYSARQRRTMPFEGLLGSAVYAAPAATLLPWFELARWLQLGAKTTFGFGVVRAQVVKA